MTYKELKDWAEAVGEDESTNLIVELRCYGAGVWMANLLDVGTDEVGLAAFHLTPKKALEALRVECEKGEES